MNSSQTPKRVAFLGNFVPRMCGIATFTSDLYRAVAQALPSADCYVAAVTDTAKGYDYPKAVTIEFQENDPSAYIGAADVLNLRNADVLCVQHEFGIYGGESGSYLLSLLKQVHMPIVTTLHTILEQPTRDQENVMRELTLLSDRLVVMSRKGKEILQSVHNVPESKIDIIPHGIPDGDLMDTNLYKAKLGIDDQRIILTFGLIGPGKGIEYVIRALPEILEKHPNVTYMILGATHPKLLASEGEHYRNSLSQLAEKENVEDHVMFYNQFVSLSELKNFIGAADIYVTPYIEKPQITSGTLAYAFGSGKAVISTPYWHAEELLENGQGVLVPFKNASAITEAVCSLFDHPESMETMQQKAYEKGRKMTWPAVAQQYIESFARACSGRPTTTIDSATDWMTSNSSKPQPPRQLNHLLRMSDGTGIFQHAIFNVPNFKEGYCVDDNARAFILCVVLAEKEKAPKEPEIDELTAVYLAFIASALDYTTGRFRNFMNHQREWMEQAGSEDSHGRSLWATGLGAARAPQESYRRLSKQLFTVALPVVESFRSPRAWAFAIIGIDEYLSAYPNDESVSKIAQALTRKLLFAWSAHSDANWLWFEGSLTYENARLSQAMILSGQRFNDLEALEVGLTSLRWLASIQTSKSGHFRPIGSNGFYTRDGNRAYFDQQPVEAQAMVAACNVAYRTTHDESWPSESRRAFDWFLGRNDLDLPLYDQSSGGCSDGLHTDRVSENQGAESTLAFHLSLAEMDEEPPQIKQPTTPNTAYSIP